MSNKQQKFDHMVDPFDQAKRQLGEMKRPVTSAATQQSPRRQRNEKRSQRSNPNRRPEIPREELDRRKHLGNKCYRCGKKDHLLPDCPRPPHHSCSNCGKQGHIRPACLKAAANNTSTRPDEDDQHLVSKLASMTIDNPLEAPQGAAQAVHSLYSTASNQPTQQCCYDSPQQTSQNSNS